MASQEAQLLACVFPVGCHAAALKDCLRFFGGGGILGSAQGSQRVGVFTKLPPRAVFGVVIRPWGDRLQRTPLTLPTDLQQWKHVLL